MTHDFKIWHELKSKLDSTPTIVSFKEREIWWCAVGRNIGVETNGKHQIFARPVIIFKKFNQYSFYGIPLTTAGGVGDWYVPFKQSGKDNKAMLNQIRAYDCRRLYNKVGTIDDADWQKIKEAFYKFFL